MATATQFWRTLSRFSSRFSSHFRSHFSSRFSSRPARFLEITTALTFFASCQPTEGFRVAAFPDDFAFGTAIAQWQTEGDQGVNGPIDGNWSRWMRLGRGENGQQNPDGNGFFSKYNDDINRAKELGLDTFRLGIDWARIAPTPDTLDEAELQHFVDVLDAIRAADMKPVVTLYHWNVPAWVQNPDGSSAEGRIDLLASSDHAVVDDFERFVRFVIPRIKDRVDTYTVLNEPFSMISLGYLNGLFPPGKLLDVNGGIQFGINLAFMHARAFDVIKELDDVDADGDGAASFVGTTMTANEFYPLHADNEGEVFAAEQISYVSNDWFVEALTSGRLDVNLNRRFDDEGTDPVEKTYAELANRLEFIGVQYYGPIVIRDDDLLRDFHPLYGRPMATVEEYNPDLPHNGMGREISAAGFRDTIERYAKWNLPLIMTENGTTTNLPPVEEESGPEEITTIPDPIFSQEQAAMYVVEHLWEVGRAISRGVDIRGYYHWTLVDNFEWVEGQRQRFGAYTVDFKNDDKPRTLNLMGEALRDIVAARAVTEGIWEQYTLPRYPTDKRADGGPTVSEPVVGILSE